MSPVSAAAPVPAGTDVRFGVTFAFRNLDPDREDHPSYLSRKLDEIAFAEELGFSELRVAEHHMVSDNYVPCPLVASAAIAVRTKTMRFGPGILTAPLYHPVRLAEECAWIDNLSGGRFQLTFGLGYREEEYAAYGYKRSQRASRGHEVMKIVMGCLGEEPFSYEGRYFSVKDVDIRPKSYQRPRFPIWVGAHSRPAMERAIELGVDGLLGAAGDFEPWKAINAELRPGQPVKFAAPLPMNLIASEDPERDWALYRDRIAAPIQTYAEWADVSGDNQRVNAPRFGKQQTDEDVKRVSRFATTDEILAAFTDRIDDLAQYEVVFGLTGGITELPSEPMTAALELFATRVMPELRVRIARRRAEMAAAP